MRKRYRYFLSYKLRTFIREAEASAVYISPKGILTAADHTDIAQTIIDANPGVQEITIINLHRM